MMKRCSKCHVDKPLSEFHNEGKFAHCKECESRRNRAYKASPVGKARQTLSKSRYAQRKIGLSVEDTITSHQVAFILNEGSCSYCQKPITYSDATVDHVIPHARGGSNTFSNVVCACSSCNTAKRDLPALLFMLQSCSPHANRKLLERLALRSGSDVTEVYAGLVADAQAYYGQQAVIQS
jgi:5-methylcytosine-specific restriction endonuclease McrA